MFTVFVLLTLGAAVCLILAAMNKISILWSVGCLIVIEILRVFPLGLK